MIANEIIESLDQKGADREAIAAEVLKNPQTIPALLEGLGGKRANIKYGSEKVLRLVSEKRPELIYPHFDRFVELLEGENNFLKWGSIMTIANLAAVDSEGRIEDIFDRYFAAITGPAMITAANIIGGAAKIARVKPALTERIISQILKVEKARYQLRGRLSPECNNVVCGHAVEALSEIYDQIGDKKRVRDFIVRQTESSRPAVRKKVKAFMDMHGEVADG
jgi:hypothetical protein